MWRTVMACRPHRWPAAKCKALRKGDEVAPTVGWAADALQGDIEAPECLTYEAEAVRPAFWLLQDQSEHLPCCVDDGDVASTNEYKMRSVHCSEARKLVAHAMVVGSISL